MIYIELFTTFFLIGIFTFGGGYAMLSLIQSEIVVKHAWLSASQFTDIVAISQMTPGPIGINSATYIGYSVPANMGFSQAGCILGSFTATLAVVLPSFLIVLSICRVYSKFRKNRMFESLLHLLKPVVIGMIAAAAGILLTPENFIDWTSWLLFAIAFIALWRFKTNPILVIIAAGLLGYFIY